MTPRFNAGEEGPPEIRNRFNGFLVVWPERGNR